jgi:hypothetical protein
MSVLVVPSPSVWLSFALFCPDYQVELWTAVSRTTLAGVIGDPYDIVGQKSPMAACWRVFGSLLGLKIDVGDLTFPMHSVFRLQLDWGASD